MYKFNINGKKVFIVANPTQVKQALQDDYILQAYTNKGELQNIITILLSNDNNSNWIIFGKDPETIKEVFSSFFQPVIAAGGVVLNENHHVLLIFRRGFWDLPKGKVDEGESIAEAALREIEEETGLNQLNILQPVTFGFSNQDCTYHSYVLNGVNCLKQTYWFMMENNGNDLLLPQTEEDIEQAIWVHKDNLHNYYDNMYESIRDVLQVAITHF